MAEAKRTDSAGDFTATALTGAFRRREISAVELVNDALSRIAATDGMLHAFCTLDEDGALVQAQALDARRAAGDTLGPLAGVPVAIKDLIATRGLRTTFGSPLYADFVPDEDDIVVERLKAAGAIVVGKTNSSEFGYGAVGHNALFATTRNPWNAALTPGGSSAGTAAAVAARMVPLGLGSDGGGSIRIPAALCGLIGMKASWGRVPLYPGCRDARLPGASGWESLEHIGPLAANVADVALALTVLAGPDPRDRHSLPAEPGAFAVAAPETLRRTRAVFSRTLGFAAVDREVAEIAAQAARRFAAALDLDYTEGDPSIEDPQICFEALVALDTDRAGLLLLAAARQHRFAGPLQRLLEQEWTAEDFTAAILARKRIANAMARFMGIHEFLLTPATASAAFPVDSEGPNAINGTPISPGDWTPFTALANLTGQPAAALPAGVTQDGRPVGLQIVGRHLADARVLTACAAYESVLPWAHRVPLIAARADAASAFGIEQQSA
ncbi:MAG: amidase [Telmatospirillum sp.]|nr:amidase [Telmatospirillum sp.]